MSTISLSELKAIQNTRMIPLHQSKIDYLGQVVIEPLFDYDESGEAVEFHIDEEPLDPTPADIETATTLEQALLGVSPSQFAEVAIRVPEAGRISDFSFEGREYLRKIYDTDASKVLLKCGRQVEKCCRTTSLILLANGRQVEAGTVRVGDEVATMAEDGSRMTTGKVVWVSRRYRKPCLRITTRQGHVVEVATTHPMRLWEQWVEGGELENGTRLAAVRSAGKFTGTCAPEQARIRLTAYMLGDGYFGNSYSFTSLPGAKLDEFCADISASGGTYKIEPKKHSDAVAVRIHRDSVLYDWIRSDSLSDSRSATKFVPSWVFDLSKQDTALFLNRLWSTDGHVKKNGRSKYSIEYCSISPQLIHDVQSLLWKFGISSKIRTNWPNIYKKRREKKLAYILRIETAEGVLSFLDEIACLGKSEAVSLPDLPSNNNRDTYPVEINDLIRQVIDSRGPVARFGRFADKRKSLRTAGLRETLKYPLTRDKLATYVDFFRLDDRYDQSLVDQLEKHLFTDLYWDEIVDIKPIGEQECVDYEVESTHNFVVNGLITHNSTTLGNRLLCYSALTNNFRSLYVAPSAEQAKVFSNDRIKDVIDASPMLRTYTSSKINQAVFFKKFINYSQIRLRYAYLTADRVRGIPADLVLIDEIQDILIDNIPVIEQCAFHSKYKLFLYSGTPKSVDNTIEFYWSEFSTQNEWVVPCDRHGLPSDSSTWHWNVLGEKHITSSGLVCDRCFQSISAQHPMAQWAAMNPKTANNKDKVTYEGYRVPQIMVPWVDWEEIVVAQEQYSRAQFMNEKLGMSYDSGVRPITRAQLQAICKDEIRITDIEAFRQIAQGRSVYAGVDWGPGENASYTVISMGGYLGTGNFSIFYIHRFTGQDLDPERQLDIISQMLAQCQVRITGTDYGGGFYPNDKLIKRFGATKIMKYQYNPRQKKKIYWEPNLKRWMCHRTETMSDVFNAMKARKIDLPCWEDFQDPYGSDILNIFTEYNERLRMNEYKRPPGKTDDAFHSILLCLLASMIENPRPDIITPLQESGIPENYA